MCDYSGTTPILFTVLDSMNMASGPVPEMVFADTTRGSTMTLDAGLTPDLGGTLRLGFATGMDPSPLIGHTFDLFNWNSRLTPGDRFDLIATLPGLTWDTGSLYTTGEVTLTGVPEPGMAAMMLLAAIAPIIRKRR